MRTPRALKRADQILIVIKRLRQSTTATLPMVKDYIKRWHYDPLAQRSNYVRFVNNSFVSNWLKREAKEQNK